MSPDEGAQRPSEILELKIRNGIIDREEVDRARFVYLSTLAQPIELPTGERIQVTAEDFDHLIDDDRIRRKPHRIRTILERIYEIRSARFGRRAGFSSWTEQEAELHACVILDVEGTVRSLHIIDARDVRKRIKRGELLWRHDK